MRRMLFVPAAALVGVLLVAGPAWAHNEFDPDEAGTGKVVQLQLSVENEQADAGTTQVQLFFPEGVADHARRPARRSRAGRLPSRAVPSARPSRA